MFFRQNSGVEPRSFSFLRGWGVLGTRLGRGGKMFCLGAPVTHVHGCHNKDASHMRRGNCTISIAY